MVPLVVDSSTLENIRMTFIIFSYNFNMVYVVVDYDKILLL